MRRRRAEVGILTALALLGGCGPEDLSNRAPVAQAGRDLRVVRRGGEAFVKLDGTESHDPDGDALGWRWSVVRAPTPLSLSAAQRRAPSPVVALEGSGLYIFALQVTDRIATSGPDLVNVWVNEQGADDEDAGVGDAGDGGVVARADGGDTRDAGPMSDGGASDPEDGAVEASDGGPGGGEDQPPVAEFDLSAARVRVGETVRMSAARSRDERGPGGLQYTWTLVQPPFGSGERFTTSGVAAAFTPGAPGRYLFRLSVSDGVLRVEVLRAVQAAGEVGYLFYPANGTVAQIDLGTGDPTGVEIPLVGPGELVGYTVRAGVLYATFRPPGRAPLLVIAAPGQGVVERELPADAAPGEPVAAVDGVWVPMRGVARLFFSDPLGQAPLREISLPDDIERPSHLAVAGNTGVLTTRTRDGLVVSLDLARGALSGRLLATDPGCLPADVVADDDWIYFGCRNLNAVVRTGWAPATDAVNLIGLAGDFSPRNERMVWAGRRLVVRHQYTDYVSVLDPSRFDLPVGDPRRARGAQQVLPIENAVVDVDARGDLVYALVSDAAGRTVLLAYDLSTQRRVWRRRQAPLDGALFRLDAADDFSRDLGDL